jgi:antagonist of KipI
MPIHIKEPGLLTTVQDIGRYEYSHMGIAPAGAADRVSLCIANLLVGNEENAAALEMTLLGAALEFDEACVVALTGAECDCKLGGEVVRMWEAVQVRPGAVLTCGGMKTGARLYLAVQGGLHVRLIMGSASTHLSGHFGGLEGRKLKKGDSLRMQRRPTSRVRRLKPGVKERLYPRGPIRVTKGPQREWFGPEAFEKLFSCAYMVSEESNRSGLRLKGEAVWPREQSQLVTEGIPLGAIQVPQDGQPIILFVDQQTTGGYPKIANVIAADMHRVGQLRPREQVRFAEVTIPEAIWLLREQEEWLRQIFGS